MERNQMHRRLANMKKSLLDQGFLDEQFLRLEELQDASNPNFVEEVVTLYYRDSARLILNIQQSLDNIPLDFAKLDGHIHQLKGSSSSIGDKKVKNECTKFHEHCHARNADRCMRTFQQLQKDYSILRNKLKTYFQLARQVGPIDMARRPK
ncbi:Histidine-containing phosphotransfer protein [Heracleum sosnowskyi]|uniref:Histidine-containing phosphotransfer protein n=1 Tax=Heracleum sosnowskyi TaxID=360622 RepID=A0AAD8H5Y8_9APIA|nr:Histidine-containing phosphotransfer protein [Heracleum sosnowskyi]